ncbi:MAG: hypothetical protein U0169_03635 [Polyangiaceae bacterium]
MHVSHSSSSLLPLFLFASALAVAGCSSSSSDATDGGTSDAAATSDSGTTTSEGGSGDAGGTYVEPTCTLRDDTGGPGQYNDGCVQRSWIKDYAGTYTSTKCELTIDLTGSAAAVFTVKVLTGPLTGTLTTLWNGGTGVGNDSYYRFTTDATFTTTKDLNFNASEKIDGGEESISLRVNGLDKGAPTFTGIVSRNTEELDCGAYTKK